MLGAYGWAFVKPIRELYRQHDDHRGLGRRRRPGDKLRAEARIRVVEGGEVDHLFRPRWPRVGASEIVNAWPIMKNDVMAANMQQFFEGIRIMVFLRGMPFFADLVGREPERRRKIVTAWPIMKMTLCCQNAAVHRRHWNHGVFTRNAFILGTNSDFCRQKDRNVNLTWN